MTSPVNILLVDDETRNLDALESVLQSPDYGLIRAQSADQALLLLLEGDFAAIILDIRMPEITGIELANLIKRRKRTQHIPIIFLTAYYQGDKEELEGYGIGAVDYLTKPLNPQILKSKIGVFVDLFRKTRALEAANAALEQEVMQRQNAEGALRLANNELEERVKERTAELVRANEELVKREASLLVSEAQARAASRAKDDFLAALSHELRTPLNPVLLLATDAATNPKLPTEVRTDFETIAKNVTLEARLIDDLLDLTRITNGKLKLEMRPCDIHASLHDALEMTRDEIKQKQIHLSLKLNAPRYQVHGDDVRLKQVFWNVIKNAVKFTPEGGKITIDSTVLENEGPLMITITDTGIGMTPSELEHIFQAFSQGDHVIRDSPHRFGGLGLGLAISKMMVKLHAGSISATSLGRNQGSTIFIKLPLFHEKAAPASALELPASVLPPPNAAASHRVRRILLVEDHLSTAQALAQLLTRRQYEVVVANCLAEARAFANGEKFDLLVSDIGLPDGTGYELMSELRGHSGLMGIALTGYGSEDDVNRSHAAGFLLQLTKPVSIQALDNALAVISRNAEGS
ncbi:MAG TPA: response regulator [Opitutales bacterium]|jgi:signal transduction histidine kinase|nr:response regulator [Opitutales bacterium]